MTRRVAEGTPNAPRSKNKINEIRLDFPAKDAGPDQALHRAHRARNGAIYYCTNGHCRFDPPVRVRRPDGNGRYGTCCTADQSVVALLEHLDDQKMMTTEWVSERRISTITPQGRLKVADLLEPTTAGRWHIGADLQAGTNRTKTQGWGAAFHDAGFDGVRHKSRRDPSLSTVCIAFFGPPGPGGQADHLVSGKPEPISRSLLEELAVKFGVRAFPHCELREPE
jgi:hypothetical protein